MREESLWTRRGVVRGAAALAAAAGLGMAGCAVDPALASDDGSNAAAALEPGREVRYGMLIDARKCIGCDACLRACHRQNRLPDGVDFIHFPELKSGTPPYVSTQVVPVQCAHCDDAPCATVCPTGATHRGEGGIVEVDEGRCIGCKYCMAACPYQARVDNPETGTVDKCRFCASKVGTDDELRVSCVEACINHARIFGDLNDPDSEVSKAIRTHHAQPLLGDLTQAKIFYVR